MTVSEEYRTVADRGESEFVIEGSRFCGVVEPVESVQAAEGVIEAVREDHPEATHVIPAYRVTDEDGYLREYASDEGEPTGSAGKPARSVLERRSLSNCVAVVARYYGGTDLGIGGLVRAYARAVSDAIEHAGVETRRPHEELTVTVEYDDSGTVRSILESEGVSFDAEYEETVTFRLSVPTDQLPKLTDRLESATSGRASLHQGR